jgi:hypothetical protein
MRVSVRVVLALVLAVIAGWIAFRLVPKPLPELSRAEFLSEVREGHVHEIAVQDREVITGVSSTRGAFRTPYNEDKDANLLTELRAQGVEVVFETSGPGLI